MTENTERKAAPPGKRQTVAQEVEALKRAAKRDKRKLLKLMPGALRHRSPKVRDCAVLLATKLHLKEAVHLVEPLLRDNNEGVRYDSAECVGILERGRKSSPAGLLNLLQDSSALVRAQALESLALLEDRKALPKIVQLLSDREPVVRSYAATTIGELNGTAFLRNIQSGLATERIELARVGFYEALFSLGYRKTLPDMLMLLQSSNYHVRCAAANALESMPLDAGEVELASGALRAASLKPLFRADETTTSRVLKTLKSRQVAHSSTRRVED
jgi:HEAT repeat protein